MGTYFTMLMVKSNLWLRSIEWFFNVNEDSFQSLTPFCHCTCSCNEPAVTNISLSDIIRSDSLLAKQWITWFHREDILQSVPVSFLFVLLKTFTSHVWHIIPSDSVFLWERNISVWFVPLMDIMPIIGSVFNSVMCIMALVERFLFRVTNRLIGRLFFWFAARARSRRRVWRGAAFGARSFFSLFSWSFLYRW